MRVSKCELSLLLICYNLVLGAAYRYCIEVDPSDFVIFADSDGGFRIETAPNAAVKIFCSL